MTILRRTWVQAHARRMPARSSEYEAVHAALLPFLEQERRIEAVMTLYFEPAAVREIQRELENSDLTQEQVDRIGEWV